MAPTNGIVTAATAVLVNTPHVRAFSNSLPGGSAGKAVAGAALVFASTKVDGIAGAALLGAGVGMALDGLLSMVLVRA